MTAWLIDKSALVRLARSGDRVTWVERIERGLVRISSLTRLEVGYSTRSADDLRVNRDEPPVASMPVEYLTPTMEDRAGAVQAQLADRGQHRAPSIPDLLIAAIAEISDLTVLHVDKDYELVGRGFDSHSGLAPGLWPQITEVVIGTMIAAATLT